MCESLNKKISLLAKVVHKYDAAINKMIQLDFLA